MKLTRKDYAYATGIDQATYLKLGMKHSLNAFSHLLFSYCVAEYKKSPTKLKAIFIWDTFLSAIGSSSLNIDSINPNAIDLSIDECGKPEVMPPIKFWIDTLRNMRAEALRMNRVARYFTSNDRKPPPHLFDDFLKNSVARSGDSVWGDIVGRLNANEITHMDTYKKIVRNLPAIRTMMKDAGFSETATRLPSGTD